MRSIGALDRDAAPGDRAGRGEGRRPQLLRLEAGGIGVGDVLGEQLLARLMPVQARLEHRDKGDSGDGHWQRVSREPGKNCRHRG